MEIRKTPQNIKKIISIVVIFILVSALLTIIYLLTRQVDDLTIIKDFAKIQAATDNFYRDYKRLPTDLNELKLSTAQSYEYKITGVGIYKLCSNFKAAAPEDIASQAGISVVYKQGYDCVVFNAIATNAQGLNVIKNENELLPLKASFITPELEGTSQGKFTYKLDATRSLFFKDNTSGNYLANLFVSVLGAEQCSTAATANKEQCCYKWTSISAKSTSAIDITHNKLGSSEYINPFAQGSENSFGELPVSFCLSGTKQISGGISLVIPAASYKDKSVDFDLNFNEATTQAVPLNIKITVE